MTFKVKEKLNMLLLQMPLGKWLFIGINFVCIANINPSNTDGEEGEGEKFSMIDFIKIYNLTFWCYYFLFLSVAFKQNDFIQHNVGGRKYFLLIGSEPCFWKESRSPPKDAPENQQAVCSEFELLGRHSSTHNILHGCWNSCLQA